MQLLGESPHKHFIPLVGWRDIDTYNKVLIFKYASGGDLAHKIGKLSLDESYYLAIECAEALDELHQQRIIHCDIKPDNFLIDELGKILIADFENAVQLSPGKEAAFSERGDERYASPEILYGAGISFATDIYSLGVTLWELFSGQAFTIKNEDPIILQDNEDGSSAHSGASVELQASLRVIKITAKDNLNFYFKAVLDNDCISLARYLALGISIDTKNKEGYTAFELAAQYSNAAIIKILLRHGANPQLYKSDAPLSLAIAKNNTQAVLSLLEAHPPVLGSNKDGSSATSKITSHKMLALLDQNGIYPSQTEATNFFITYSGEDKELFWSLLIKQGANVNEKNDKGFFPLYDAVWKRDLAKVKFLLNHNADPSVLYNDRVTILALAMCRSNSELIDYLLMAADKDPRFFVCNKPLLCCSKSPEVTARLLKKLIVISDQNELNSLFDDCLLNKDYAALDLLLESGADLDIPVQNISTPRVIMYDYSTLEAIKYQTPLFKSAGIGEIELAEYLLAHNADPRICCDGLTPLSIAVKMNDVAMVKFLLNKAKTNPHILANNANGSTAISCLDYTLYASCNDEVDSEPDDEQDNAQNKDAVRVLKMAKLLLEAIKTPSTLDLEKLKSLSLEVKGIEPLYCEAEQRLKLATGQLKFSTLLQEQGWFAVRKPRDVSESLATKPELFDVHHIF